MNSKLKSSIAVIGIATLAGSGAAAMLPMASAKADSGVQIAACKPCAAKKGCNPCAAKKGCNPCATKKGCNPCAAKKGCNPCATKKKK